jgi:hypothetical protein
MKVCRFLCDAAWLDQCKIVARHRQGACEDVISILSGQDCELARAICGRTVLTIGPLLSHIRTRREVPLGPIHSMFFSNHKNFLKPAFSKARIEGTLSA